MGSGSEFDNGREVILTVTYPSGTIFCDIAHRVISLALTNVGEKGQRAHPLCDEDRVGLFSSAHRIEAKRKSFSHVESRWGARLRMAAFT